MGIAIDIGIVLIMMLSIFIGYKKGLIKVAISFLAIIVSLVVAIIVYKPLAKQIANNTQIYEKIENLKKSYGSGESKNQVLKGISLSIKDGDFVVILGTSGSGKSTLLNVISGL